MLCVFTVSCSISDSVINDNITTREKDYYCLTELNMRKSKLVQSLEEVFKQMPSNAKSEMYLLSVNIKDNKPYVFFQNWSLETLEDPRYCFMGIYKHDANSLYAIVYYDKRTLSKLKKFFKETKNKICIPKVKTHYIHDSRIFLYDDIVTYFKGEIKDNKIIANRMIIKNKVYK